MYTHSHTHIPVCANVYLCMCVHMYANERVEEFKYLGTMLTNQNSIHEEIRAD